MLHYTELEFEKLIQIAKQARIIRTNKKVSYYNLSTSFDIETTSVYHKNEKVAFMYIWMYQIEDVCVYGRTWNEFREFMFTLKKAFALNTKRFLVTYVHNLSYEFQFMLYELEWKNVFAVDERKPIKAICDLGIEFRDSYILSGLSLEKTANNLTSTKLEKLVGNLDYTKIRHARTTLSQDELDYCEYDVKIVVAYIREQINEYGDITKIPMTNTGRVRKYVRDKCYFTNKCHKKSNKGKFQRYRKMMLDLTLTSDVYLALKQSFQGGYTHANHIYTNQLLKNVSSIDFTSSYPSVMLSEKFPMSRAKELDFDYNEMMNNRAKYNYIVLVELENVLPNMYEHYISESKCLELEKPIINNGRVASCSRLKMWCTEIDLDIINQCYKYEYITIHECYGFLKNYLPKPIIESILQLYQDKTTLKGVKGKEAEYLKSKGMLNSIYGMSVTDVVQKMNTFDGCEWVKEEPNFDEEIEKYNKNKKRFLYYPWGIFVTAYARRNLWLGIVNFGKDYVYSDTDSIKCLNYENHIPFIEKYNELITKKIETVLEYYGLDKTLMKPKTIKGVEKPIGVWDFEGTYDYFKTLGAKRYLVYEEEDFQLTVAGLSKRNGINYMKRVCNNEVQKVFDMFNDELYIPSCETGKHTHTYIDNTYELDVTDFNGVTYHVKTNSGVHLSECEFTLSLSKQYAKFIEDFRNGYIFKGVTANA